MSCDVYTISDRHYENANVLKNPIPDTILQKNKFGMYAKLG